MLSDKNHRKENWVEKIRFRVFSLNSFFFASFAYAVCTMWNNNYVMNISKLPRVIINCTCDMEQQLFANTWFNYQFTETKKLFDEELFCILWVTIFLTECKSFDAKLGEIVTVLHKLNLMNSFQMSDILKGLFCNKIVDCPQTRYPCSKYYFKCSSIFCR